MLVRDPVITLDHIAVTSVSLPEIGLNVTLDVDNPNLMGITLKTIVFDVYYRKEMTGFLSATDQEPVSRYHRV